MAVEKTVKQNNNNLLVYSVSWLLSDGDLELAIREATHALFVSDDTETNSKATLAIANRLAKATFALRAGNTSLTANAMLVAQQRLSRMKLQTLANAQTKTDASAELANLAMYIGEDGAIVVRQDLSKHALAYKELRIRPTPAKQNWLTMRMQPPVQWGAFPCLSTINNKRRFATWTVYDGENWIKAVCYNCDCTTLEAPPLNKENNDGRNTS